MLDFPSSTFTWRHHPWVRDENYKYAGGFVGKEGQVYHVRFSLEASCEIVDTTTQAVTRLYLGAPCRTEYTIARRNLFQIPSAEWRLVFSASDRIPIARRPSTQQEKAKRGPLSSVFSDTRIDLRSFNQPRELDGAAEVIAATFANHRMNARSTYADVARGLEVTVEYPVNLINVNEADAEFQVCTGPVILPDLATWDGEGVDRVFLAHVAITSFDFVEFILQREVAAAATEREWLDTPRGLDRHELWDPENPPSGYPPARPQPTVYNETWELDAKNSLFAAPVR